MLTSRGTRINFEGRNSATAVNYIQDGITIQEPSYDGFVPIEVSGSFVDPEPASLAWAVGALALLRRRSK